MARLSVRFSSVLHSRRGRVAAPAVLGALALANKVIATVTVAPGPFGLAVDPRTGDVDVSDGAHGRVQVISGKTDKVTATVVTGTQGWLAVNPRTSDLYVDDDNDNAVMAIMG